jgi:hypothetical protein
MKIKKLLNLSILTLFITSNAFAGVTVGAPSTTLTQVANSMNFTSSTNNNVNPSVTSSQTSTVINTTSLIENVTKAADDAGLDIDQQALDILLNNDEESDDLSKKVSDAKNNIVDDIYSDDKKPTLDSQTIVYKDADWMDLTKVDGVSSVTGLSYSTANDFFDFSGTQQAKTATYVNLATNEISAKIWTRVTRVGSSTAEGSFFTGVAALEKFPAVGSTVRRFNSDGSNTWDNWHDTPTSMVKNATELVDTWDGEASTLENQMDAYNNNFDGSESAVFVTAKALITDSVLSGTVAVEAGHCEDACTEQAFVESVERWEASTTLVAEEWDGTSPAD